jgi:hypothetical protein
MDALAGPVVAVARNGGYLLRIVEVPYVDNVDLGVIRGSLALGTRRNPFAEICVAPEVGDVADHFVGLSEP